MDTRDDVKADANGRFELTAGAGQGSQFYIELQQGPPKWPLRVVPDKNEGAAVLVYDERPVRIAPFTTLEVLNAGPGSQFYTAVAGANEHLTYHARTRPTVLCDVDFLGAVTNGQYDLATKVKNPDMPTFIDVRHYRYVKLALMLREGVAEFGAQVIGVTLTGYDVTQTETVGSAGKEYSLANIGSNVTLYASISLGEVPAARVDLLDLADTQRFSFVTARATFIGTSPSTEMDVGAGLRAQLIGYP